MSKPWFSKDFLYQKYIIEQKGSYKIAKELGCSNVTILRWLKKLGIPVRKRNKKIELSGQRFGRLIVLRDSGKRNKRRCTAWRGRFRSIKS